MNYKNTQTGEIISYECYNKLPLSKQVHYVPVYDEPTHKYYSDDNNDDGFSLLGLGSLLSGGIDLGGSFGGDSTTPDFGGFGGGDAGGGGASGDW